VAQRSADRPARREAVVDEQVRDRLGHVRRTVTGPHRTELDGCYDLDLRCTPFTHSLAIRRLPLLDGHTATGITSCIAANRISYLLDLRGPSVAVDTACSSSFVALHSAIQSIENGDAEIALVSAVNLILSPETHIAFSSAGFMSPTGRCHAFSADADGYARAEGVATVLIKPYDRALWRTNMVGVFEQLIGRLGASNPHREPKSW
jgi:hypothetical protein